MTYWLLLRTGKGDFLCKSKRALWLFTMWFLVTTYWQLNIHKIYGRCGMPAKWTCSTTMGVNHRANGERYCRKCGECKWKRDFHGNEKEDWPEGVKG